MALTRKSPIATPGGSAQPTVLGVVGVPGASAPAAAYKKLQETYQRKYAANSATIHHPPPTHQEMTALALGVRPGTAVAFLFAQWMVSGANGRKKAIVQ